MVTSRTRDGSAGDADYSEAGRQYREYRRPDPRIAKTIWTALGDARSVLNVGAGTGSYEPVDREVVAVEPSAQMRANRPSHLPAAIDAVAESLPFADGTFDAAMTTFSVHQCGDLRAGLREMRRVTRGPIVILTCDPALLDRFWLADFAEEVIATEQRRMPSMAQLAEGLGGKVSAAPVPIPWDCVDGFNEAYYGRPEMLLDPLARAACSSWSFIEPDRTASYLSALREALASGDWDARYGELRRQPQFEGSLVLVRTEP